MSIWTEEELRSRAQETAECPMLIDTKPTPIGYSTLVFKLSQITVLHRPVGPNLSTMTTSIGFLAYFPWLSQL